MKRLYAVAAALALAVALPASVSAQVFFSELNGADEVPGPGDDDGAGQAAARIDGTRIDFDIQVQNVTLPLTLAHIHQGAAGVSGPVVVDFTPFIDGERIRGSVTVTDALAAQIAADPAGFYFNVHNGDFPGGAVRGQLALQAVQTFAADLSGANEVPGPGDPDGSGTASAALGGSVVAFDLSVSDIALPPTMAHIHSGAAGASGPVVIDFDPSWDGGTASGVVVADSAVISDVVADPAGFYFNVHTTDFPGGAVRGQVAGEPPPPPPATTIVPANSVWALAALVALLAMIGWLYVRR